MSSKTPEGWVKEEIKKILDHNHIIYSMKTTSGFGKSGWPDFDVVFFGVYVTIEAKFDVENKGPTALQLDTMRQIRESGGITLLVDRHNLTELAQWVDVCALIHEMEPLTPVSAAFQLLNYDLTQDYTGKK